MGTAEIEQTLAGACYRDPEIFRLEADRIFARTWYCLGRSEVVDAPRRYLATDVAGRPIVVLRDGGGVLRAFHNVCRHRGAMICDPGSGGLRGAITCPYHGWSYDLEGRLVGTPNIGKDEIPRDRIHLYPVRVDEWQGCLFVNLSDDASPLQTWLDRQHDEPRQFERWEPGRLRVAHTTSSDVNANWKILIENYGECLHCPRIHPELVSLVPTYRTGGVSDPSRSDYGVGLRPGAHAMTLSGEGTLPILPGLTAEEGCSYYGAHIFPNTTLDFGGTFATLQRIVPRAVDRSTRIIEYLFAPETIARPGFDPTEVIEFNELVVAQDHAICERVQQGVNSQAFERGVYVEKDRGPVVFDRTYAEMLGPIATGHAPGSRRP
jgi:Rieske 2Fe-2S family protein